MSNITERLEADHAACKQNDGVRFIKTHIDAVLPKRNHEESGTGDSGWDITAVEDTLVPARGTAVVPVGLKLAFVPKHSWLRIESRSGLAFKHNVVAFNGIIDNGYRGDCGVKLFNHSDVDYIAKRGDRVAQFVLYPLTVVRDWSWSEEAVESDRGEKGFGSSGQ